VSDTNFMLTSGLWGGIETWRAVVASARPDLVLAPGANQVLTVQTDADADPTRVAAAIDAATGGMTRTVTRTVAVDALPGITQQR
jgi:putative ABC transport system permease protein